MMILITALRYDTCDDQFTRIRMAIAFDHLLLQFDIIINSTNQACNKRNTTNGRQLWINIISVPTHHIISYTLYISSYTLYYSIYTIYHIIHTISVYIHTISYRTPINVYNSPINDDPHGFKLIAKPCTSTTLVGDIATIVHIRRSQNCV